MQKLSEINSQIIDLFIENLFAKEFIRKHMHSRIE